MLFTERKVITWVYTICIVDNVALWLNLENNWPWLFQSEQVHYLWIWNKPNILPHYQPISNSEPFTLPTGEYAASQTDFEDKWGWFIQLLCPDDKIGAT